MPTCDDSDFEDKSVTIAGDKEVLEEQLICSSYIRSYQMMIMPVTLKLNSTTTLQ